MIQIEIKLMAYRYLYYVKNTPIISDMEYDELEKKALKTLDKNSLLRSPGSDMESSYNSEIKALAQRLLIKL